MTNWPGNRPHSGRAQEGAVVRRPSRNEEKPDDDRAGHPAARS